MIILHVVQASRSGVRYTSIGGSICASSSLKGVQPGAITTVFKIPRRVKLTSKISPVSASADGLSNVRCAPIAD